MTPKEKADELFDKFYDTNTHPNSVMVRTETAKKSALICVEEIINSSPTNPLKCNYLQLQSDIVDEATEFWNEVKRILSN